jgi:cytochrome c peroxidase
MRRRLPKPSVPQRSRRIAKALEQFLLTLVSQDSRFDRAARKVAELTESEKRGLRLFVTEFDPKRGLRGADCFHCHGGTLFTSQQFANNGLELSIDDLGRMAVTKNAADRGKFKTPSLRNIARTAPYMHDGRFATLEEVVEHYSSGVRRTDTLDPNLAKHPEGGIQLTTEEKADLVDFLKTLTDESFTGAATTTAAR